jgi:hypothetical protein
LGEIRLFLIDDKIEEMICSLNGILFVLWDFYAMKKVVFN